MTKIKLAIDSCGDLTTRTILPHLQLPDAKEQFEVVALCDIVPEKAHDLAEQFNIPQYFSSLDEMLKNCDADAVLVVVPAQLHVEHALKAMQSGRHVYVQKPMAQSLGEANALLAAMSEYSLHVVAAPHQAHWPLYQEIKKLIDSGELGVPYLAFGPLVGWDGYNVQHPSNPVRYFTKGSGPLRDHGVYGLQSLTSMLGPMTRVAAIMSTRINDRLWQGQKIEVTESDCASLLLECASGAQAMLGETWSAGLHAASTFRIHCLEGVIQGSPDFMGYQGVFPLAAQILLPGQQPREIRVKVEEVPFLQNGHADLENQHVYADIWHLGQCIRSQADSRPSAQQARHTVDILETALKAARNRRVLELATSF
jgi:predicted dehydrogenase